MVVLLQGAAAKCCFRVLEWCVRCGAGLPVPLQGAIHKYSWVRKPKFNRVEKHEKQRFQSGQARFWLCRAI